MCLSYIRQTIWANVSNIKSNDFNSFDDKKKSMSKIALSCLITKYSLWLTLFAQNNAAVIIAASSFPNQSMTEWSP